MINFLYQIWVLFVEMSPYLLLGITFVAILDAFVTKDFISRQVRKNNLSSIVKTALFGIPLPLCSCGVVPTSVYLRKSGASKPSVVSFLIATPQTGVDSIVATYGMLGPIFAVFRPLAALAMGILGGIVTMFFSKSEKEESTSPANSFAFEGISEQKKPNFTAKIKKSLRYAFVEFIDDISTQFLFGLVIAGAIAFFVPDDFFASLFNGNELLAMISILIFAVPMYVCATASIPIAVSLMMKGFSPGVAYVFLVAGPVSNAASLAILHKVLGKKLLAVYVLVVSLSSIIFGFLLNFIFEWTNVNPHSQMSHSHIHNTNFSLFDYLFALIFLILILSSIYRKYFVKTKGEVMEIQNAKTFKIEGMTCNHCVMNVEKAIRSIPGVSDVQVVLNEGIAIVKGDYSIEAIKNAVENIGYRFAGEK
jgi:uncharacterized membrane protein YraQ (UPF0718 family)/copper chaperone CopZ